MRRIGVLTGNRAEYGLLRSVLKKIVLNPKLELLLYVTGAHLNKSKGNTVQEIEKDNFFINERIFISDVSVKKSTAEVMGEVTTKFGEVFRKDKPDIFVVLGDRFEVFAAVTAAVASHIPVAHIHGGEISIGSIDNQWRNGITKLANLHFCATEEFATRIEQMGEEKKFIFNCGALGVENIKNVPLLSKEELEKNLAFTFKEKNFLVTYHPETSYSDNQIRNHFKNLLEVLEKYEGGIIITYPNADRGNDVIIEESIQFAKKHADRCLLIESLGLLRYLSCLKVVDLVIGNSSSGLIEVPSFKIGTVNIGNRQLGRLAPKSVIQSGYEKEKIKSAIDKGLSGEFRKKISKEFRNPYEQKGTSEQIVKVLSEVQLKGIIFKTFIDK